MSEPRPIISLRGITKTYHSGELDVSVLRGIDLDVAPGEYIALVGRSGAGKSTLMNIIGCLDLPTTGTYELDGRDVSSLDDDVLSQVRGKAIGFVFQSFHLLPSRTVEGNVELPMEYQQMPAERRRLRALELVERVGLGHRLGHYPRQLSGGERQRVAIARALANAPKVLLADEPTGNLDTAARDRVLALFEELLDTTDVTLVIVTHDGAISRLARRCVTLSDGRIVDDARRGG